MTNDAHPCPRCGLIRSASKRQDRTLLCRDCVNPARIERARPWAEYAACRESPVIDPDWWWPVKEDPKFTTLPLAICHRICQVRDLCLDYAVNRPEPEGIWGGTLPSERRQMIARRRRVG